MPLNICLKGPSGVTKVLRCPLLVHLCRCGLVSLPLRGKLSDKEARRGNPPRGLASLPFGSALRRCPFGARAIYARRGPEGATRSEREKAPLWAASHVVGRRCPKGAILATLAQRATTPSGQLYCGPPLTSLSERLASPFGPLRGKR